MRGGGFGVPGRSGEDFPWGKWTGRRTAASGVSAPAGGIVHAGCAPHFLFETSKRKCAAPGGKEKMFGGSVCAGADLLPPAGDSWHSLVEVRDGNARPLGKPLARGSWGYLQPPSPLPLALPHRGVSGSEKRSRGNALTTPTSSAPSATGRQFQKPQKAQACPTVSPNRSRHRSADPRAHGGPPHRSAPSVFLFGPCTARFSFGKTKEKWGVHPAGQAPLWEQNPPRPP